MEWINEIKLDDEASEETTKTETTEKWVNKIDLPDDSGIRNNSMNLPDDSGVKNNPKKDDNGREKANDLRRCRLW